MDVKVDAKPLLFALRGLGDDFDDPPTKGAAEVAAKAAARLARRRSGRMAHSTKGFQGGRGFGEIRVGVVYGGVQNFGWRAHNIAPDSFLERGWTAAQQQAADRLAADMQPVINRRGLAP